MMSPVPTADLQRMASAELSSGARAGHVGLLLASSAMGIALASLWLTESALPARTHMAFAAMTTIAASWVAYSIWVLSTRRVLFGRQRVVAARMAVLFTAVFIVGALLVGVTSGGRAPFVAAATGVVMLAVAAGLLVRARSAHAQLVARRDELSRQLR